MLAATPALFDPLTLPCGLRLENRIVKAAMEENLSSRDYVPDGALFTLYRRSSRGGAGLLLTGNVMVDHRALTGPGGVVLEAETGLAPFREWAAAAKSGGAKVVMQISHPGWQIYAGLGLLAIAPSSVPLEMGRFSSMFERPVEITPEQIEETVGRFVATAVAAERAGFDGVQIHAAHGYLVSQFLSPLANRRTDAWGGSLENRARFLLRIVDGVRAAVDPGFAVAVKLNSADFQRGGFDADDARAVVAMLNERAIDFVELSGGSYESPAMQGTTADARTLAREAFFLEFAVEMLAAARMPLMVTGGISRRETAERVIASGVALAGVGTALALEPDLPAHWRDGEHCVAPPPELRLKSKALRALARMNYVAGAIRQLSAGNAPRTRSSLLALMQGQASRLRLSRRYRVWRKRKRLYRMKACSNRLY